MREAKGLAPKLDRQKVQEFIKMEEVMPEEVDKILNYYGLPKVKK